LIYSSGISAVSVKCFNVLNARTVMGTWHSDKPIIIHNVAAAPPSFGGQGDLLHRRRIFIFDIEDNPVNKVFYPF